MVKLNQSHEIRDLLAIDLPSQVLFLKETSNSMATPDDVRLLQVYKAFM